MAKYKLVFNRKDCIGTAACASMNEDHWVIGEDGKSNLKDSKLNEKTGFFELEFDEKELEAKMQVASVCPVEVIMIYKIDEAGKETKFFPNY